MKTIRSTFTSLAIRFPVALSVALLGADISSHLILAEDVTNTLSATLSSLKGTAAAQGDATLTAIGGELQTKAESLNQSLAANTGASTALQTALQSLSAGKSANSLASLQKLSAAKLTPEQTKLAADVYHIGTAYVIQKQFASLDGAQNDVVKAVSALRKGETLTALPSIQSIAQNAKLTAPQKELIQSVASQYAPGVEKVGNALKGLGNLPAFGK